MILTDQSGRLPAAGTGGRTTLDDLFRRAAARRPQALALIDPPNRGAFTDGAPRRLTYAQADWVISAVAGRLRRMGLHTDAIVGLQVANTIESALALLGILRAGLIAMPLPLLWRRADSVTALGRVGANALIVSGQVGETDQVAFAQQVASEIFPVRYVCSFGHEPPDGVIPLGDLFGADKVDPFPAIERDRTAPPGPGAHLAVVTWDVAANGLVPVGRSHAELIAGGVATVLESRFEQDSVILSTVMMSSFAGLAVSLVPWLLLGGTLALHHPFDPDAFAAQRKTLPCGIIVVPGPLVAQFAEAGQFAGGNVPKHVVGVWRAPERLPRSPAWRSSIAALTDVQVFGETGLIAARRGPSGKPVAIAFGPIPAPRGGTGRHLVGEVQPTAKGTVALRGPMVPHSAFPPGAERTALPSFKVGANGFVDTGYACRTDEEIAFMAVTGPPPGLVSVGGYRFVMRDLQETVGGIEGGGTLAALPDALAGHRLAGSAAERDRVQDSLAKRGANPLLVGAFRDRRRPAA